MKTNPKAIRILCYGDSNTHARDPKIKAELGIKLDLNQEYSCTFLDLAKYVQPSNYDGIHIDEKDQLKVAKLVHAKVIELCQ
jgi:hypothetical protein